MTDYLTIARDAVAEIEERRSRFRCHLFRVEDEAAARAHVEALRRRHWDARHTCSAFVIGPRGHGAHPVERSSDDGEPAGTAGAPMLEVLRGAGLSDVVAVVTRWFGGTLLGAGGLVRAYSDVVRAGVAEAGTQRRALLREYAVGVPYDVAGRLETDLRAAGIAVLGADYQSEVRLTLAAPPAEQERLAALVAGLTAGGAVLVPGGERWVDVPSAR